VGVALIERPANAMVDAKMQNRKGKTQESEPAMRFSESVHLANEASTHIAFETTARLTRCELLQERETGRACGARGIGDVRRYESVKLFRSSRLRQRSK
jgi:hypothetical protein